MLGDIYREGAPYALQIRQAWQASRVSTPETWQSAGLWAIAPASMRRQQGRVLASCGWGQVFYFVILF